MATIRSIADEAAVALGFTHDDSRLSFNALALYVKMAVDKIRYRSLVKDAVLDPRDGADMEETFVVDLTVNTANDTVPWNCQYFNIPCDLYDLPFDGGLRWVRYHRPSLALNCPPSIAGAVFTHTSLGSLSRLYDLAYECPREDRPYVARDRFRVYVFGVHPAVTKLHVGLFCSVPDLADMDPDETLPLSPGVLGDVRRLVIDSARLALMIPERLQNDGRDLTQPQPTEKQVSINDPINIVGE